KGLSDFLRPEFLSRVDEIVVFKPLSVEDYKKIAALMLDEIIEPLAEREIKFSYDDAVLDIIAKKSHGGKFGARDIRSNIRKLIEDKVANTLVDMADNPPRIMKVTVKEGGSSKTEDDIEVLAL
ncbi:MAG: ATP-dependent Clp protease ATP-binding subunit, partial [Clostridiales bacterium]|nr:ATP-dependent Clp protease ATP-binding subunit [Clostridiales bacterium]